MGGWAGSNLVRTVHGSELTRCRRLLNECRSHASFLDWWGLGEEHAGDTQGHDNPAIATDAFYR